MSKTETNNLFKITPVSPKTELEQELETCYISLNGYLNGIAHLEFSDKLQAIINKDNQKHKEVTFGILYSILTKPENCQTMFQCLTFVTRDFLSLFNSLLTRLIKEEINQLTTVALEQIFWVLNELINANMSQVSSILFILIRNIKIGDYSKQNLWLTKKLFYLLSKHKKWLINEQNLMLHFLMHTMRLINDHNFQEFEKFRNEEIEFCYSLMINDWELCNQIGKEMIRILSSLTNTPKIKDLWIDLFNIEKKVSNVSQQYNKLLNIKTPMEYIISQIYPSLEEKLVFFLNNVQEPQLKYYYDWFIKQNLPKIENLSILPDIIRYLCIIEIPIEQQDSSIIQRWSLIGELLILATKNEFVLANSRLSLFLDYIFFDHKNETSYSLEPGIKLIFNSIDSQPSFAISLIEFIVTVSEFYIPSLNEKIRLNVQNAFKVTIEVGFIPSFKKIIEFISHYPKVKENFFRVFPDILVTKPVENISVEQIPRIVHIDQKPIINDLVDDKFLVPTVVSDITILSEFKKLPPNLPLKQIQENRNNLKKLKELFEFILEQFFKLDSTVIKYVFFCISKIETSFSGIIDQIQGDIPIIYSFLEVFLFKESNFNLFKKCMEYWAQYDSRVNLVLLFYLYDRKKPFSVYYNYIDSKTEILKRDLLWTYEYGYFLFPYVIMITLNEGPPSVVLDDEKLFKRFIKSMDTTNSIQCFNIITKLCVNKGHKIESSIVHSLLKKSIKWDTFSQQNFMRILKCYRFVIETDVLKELLNGYSNKTSLQYSLSLYMMDSAPNIKIITDILLTSKNTYYFVFNQWLSRSPSLTINMLDQCLKTNKNGNVILDFLCMFFEDNTNEILKNKILNETCFTQILKNIEKMYESGDRKIKDKLAELQQTISGNKNRKRSHNNDSKLEENVKIKHKSM